MNAIAGFTYQQVVECMEKWADQSGYALGCRGDKATGQAYFYDCNVRRLRQHYCNASHSEILPRQSTVATFAPEKKDQCCSFNVHIAYRFKTMCEELAMNRLIHCFVHNKPSQKKR